MNSILTATGAGGGKQRPPSDAPLKQAKAPTKKGTKKA